MRLYKGPFEDECLNGAGFLGCFDGDDTVHKLRLYGRAATAFGYLKKTGQEGVNHSEANRAVHPDDLAKMIDQRSQYIGKGGRWSLRYRVLNRFSEGPSYTWVEAHFTVHIDRFGMPIRTQGILLDVAALEDPVAPLTALDDLATIINSLKRLSGLAKRRTMFRLQDRLDTVRESAIAIARDRLLE